jgi:hypothetical protein
MRTVGYEKAPLSPQIKSRKHLMELPAFDLKEMGAFIPVPVGFDSDIRHKHQIRPQRDYR